MYIKKPAPSQGFCLLVPGCLSLGQIQNNPIFTCGILFISFYPKAL